MSNMLFNGSPMLLGDNTIPGLVVPKEIQESLPEIYKACKEFGLDYYDPVIQFLTYDEISEVAAYGGFPVRYPHWQWGMEYEELSKGYEHGYHRIFEMVINNDPCYIYCLDSNTYTDNVTVIAHALGHNDFFKNNIWFAPTNKNMMNKLANHRTRIIRYIERWGKEVVSKFIDTCLTLQTLIDPSKAWAKKKYIEPQLYDQRDVIHPSRFKIQEGHEYMDQWINTKEFIDKQKKVIEEAELRKDLGIMSIKEKDIMGFLRDRAPLKIWQEDILAMLYEEAMYFQPQRVTKMANEGWASFTDYNIMARLGMNNCSIIEYADHKAKVLGGKYSQNPYKLGFELFLYIEEKYNKGRFGLEYEECKDIKLKQQWDKKSNLGKEKVFEVRANYNDVMMINDFFDQEFCDKHQYYEWQRVPSRSHKYEYEYVITSKDANKIKSKLMQRYSNGGLPDIRIVDDNGKNKNILVLEHQWEGRTLNQKDTFATIMNVSKIWDKSVVLFTKNKNEEELIFYANNNMGEVTIVSLTSSEYANI
jgi:stage V sporulation protein R